MSFIITNPTDGRKVQNVERECIYIYIYIYICIEKTKGGVADKIFLGGTKGIKGREIKI
jgi:hypothetical protein